MNLLEAFSGYCRYAYRGVDWFIREATVVERQCAAVCAHTLQQFIFLVSVNPVVR